MLQKSATVFLFDIDGTLVDTLGAGRRALTTAFHKLYGRSDALKGISLGGMTDRGIVRRALTVIGYEYSESAFDMVIESYLEHLEKELRVGATVALLGAQQAMQRAALSGHIAAVGLGTGNIRKGAVLKLRAAGMWDDQIFGGFGCDAEPRHELLRCGWQRGAAQLGYAIEQTRCVVIGDTPYDIAAAQLIGALPIGVATGGYGSDALVKAGAAQVYRDLTQVDFDLR